MAEKNYFEVLNNIDVGDKIEKKNGLSYLSWAWAWGEIKKRHPDAIYTIYENADGLFYHTDGKTAWVKTGVTVNGIEHIEYLPVMDYKNKSIPIENITSTDVNKAIQRSLTKAVARHGLGLYIYAGEDLPEDKKEAKPTTDKEMDDHLEKKISANDVKIIEKMVEGKDALKTWVLQQCNVTKFEDMTNSQYGQAMRALNEHFEKKGK
jgi:hypothetical protein